MSLKGTTVTPDKRKGLVYIQQTDDSLIHFCWKDRTSGTVEDVSACSQTRPLGQELGIWLRLQWIGVRVARLAKRSSHCEAMHPVVTMVFKVLAETACWQGDRAIW